MARHRILAWFAFSLLGVGCSGAGSDEFDDTRGSLGENAKALIAPDASAASADERQFCGGIGAIACPGQGRCTDDPTDGCNPDTGGADCSGICSCIENVLCIRGSHFDSSPRVCACVPDAAACTEQAPCALGSRFDPTPGICACSPDPGPCTAANCPLGTHCVDDDGKAECVPRRHRHHSHRHHRG